MKTYHTCIAHLVNVRQITMLSKQNHTTKLCYCIIVSLNNSYGKCTKLCTTLIKFYLTLSLL